MIELALKISFSYLLGAVLGGVLVGRVRGGVDLRSVGSGNPGSTNALRTRGKLFALGVFVIDFGKGYLATRWLALADIPGLAPAASWWRHWFTAGCALAVVLGHVYPVWHAFRGGKGVATLLGAVLGIQAWLLTPMLVSWLVVVMTLGYVSLGSMLGAAALAIAVMVARVQPQQPMQVFGVAAALLIVFTHRSNIGRIRSGNEPRARKLWLAGRWSAPGERPST